MLATGPGSSFPTRMLSDLEKPTLLVLDRSFDPLTPLLHEFTYQAMVHDLLPVHEDRYEYRFVSNNNSQQSKEVLLNDTDPLWKRYRHMHIADLTTVLHSEYKQVPLSLPPYRAQLTLLDPMLYAFSLRN